MTKYDRIRSLLDYDLDQLIDIAQEIEIEAEDE